MYTEKKCLKNLYNVHVWVVNLRVTFAFSFLICIFYICLSQTGLSCLTRKSFLK